MGRPSHWCYRYVRLKEMRAELRERLVHRIVARHAAEAGCITRIAEDVSLTQGTQTCHTNFFTALTLLSLQRHAQSHDGLDDVRHALGESLQSEAISGFVTYWSSGEPLRNTRPYPADLDTTSCTFASLVLADPSGAPHRLGAAVRALTAVEVAEGGPYRTWLVTPDAPAVWRDVDVAVNANIAFYLSRHDIRLDVLDAWLAEQIASGAYASPYYPSAFPIWYFLARSAPQQARQKLTHDILSVRRPSGSWGTVLEDALAICALTEVSLDKDLLRDARAQFAYRLQTERSMGPGAFCIDVITQGRTWFAGSPLLTDALCLEALGPLSSTSKRSPTTSATSKSDEILYDIRRSLEARASRMGEPITSELLMRINRLLAGTPGAEIPLIPWVFNHCLAQSCVTNEELCLLGEANVLGWIAYTAYDDLMDGEGDIAELPLANSCLREACSIFLSFAHHAPAIRPLFEQIMDGLERANAWELQHARLQQEGDLLIVPPELPTYSDLSVLADRSLGHALGPLCVLLLNGLDKDAPDVRHLKEFFRHTLIARQLDDDAHDWMEDLEHGRLNAVGERVIRRWRAIGLASNRIGPTERAELHRLFWNEELEETSVLIQLHVDRAETALVQIASLRISEPLRALLAGPRASAQRAQSGVRGTKQLIAGYRGTERRLNET
jgi:hypothetical protein